MERGTPPPLLCRRGFLPCNRRPWPIRRASPELLLHLPPPTRLLHLPPPSHLLAGASGSCSKSTRILLNRMSLAKRKANGDMQTLELERQVKALYIKRDMFSEEKELRMLQICSHFFTQSPAAGGKMSISLLQFMAWCVNCTFVLEAWPVLLIMRCRTWP